MTNLVNFFPRPNATTATRDMDKILPDITYKQLLEVTEKFTKNWPFTTSTWRTGPRVIKCEGFTIVDGPEV